MSKAKDKPRLIGPWRNLHTAVWLVGLAILAWKGWWWPGILVLVAVSLVIQAVLMRLAPQAFDKTPLRAIPSPADSVTMPGSSPSAPDPEHPIDLLPAVCARCGGPIRGHEVKWTGARSADCPYCGANLALARG